MSIGLLNMQEYLANRPPTDAPPYKIAVLRNIMLDSIEPALRYLGDTIDLDVTTVFGEFDNIFQEACGCGVGPLTEDTDCVMVFMHLDGVSWDLSRNFPSLSQVDVQAEIERVSEHIKAALKGIRGKSPGMILWAGFELPINPALGVFDSQSNEGQTKSISKLNDLIRQAVSNTPNAYFMDMSLCLARIGADTFYDHRYWHVARAPYSSKGLVSIAHEAYKFIRALKGKNKKCLVLDCDNTLWGGIIGEDGLSGIQLSKSYPGSMFYEFQQEILNLYHRGIILALCSKNNKEDVWNVFKEHPDMVLREKHIATAQINWGNKAANLRRIAQELNIGLNSIVFCDDSSFEVELVRRELPEVEVIHLPKEARPRLSVLLAECGLFDTLTLSAEDKQRGEMYKSEAVRKKIQADATDMEGYYQTLEMEVIISLADDFSIPRIAQQTQKTNQFNLTTYRYSDEDIIRYVTADDSDVLYLKLSDRFGDSGIVGSCILKYKEDKAIIDTLLLSCRVLGRRVEDVFLWAILERAKSRGVEKVIGTYIPTRKNGQTELFFPDHGFQPEKNDKTNRTKSYVYDLNRAIPSPPSFFKDIKTTT